MASETRLGYNHRIGGLRQDEYPMLGDQVYLDHAGTTLYAKSLLANFTTDLTSNLFGNPHSASASSQLSTSRIEDIRLRLLQFFNADPNDFDLVFTANATAAIKLVVEALRAHPSGFRYVYHEACHTSLVGVREEAASSIFLDTSTVQRWVEGDPIQPDPKSTPETPTLFGYTAQSNMDGRRFPLSWSSRLRKTHEATGKKLYTLFDAAAYATTSPLALGEPESAPDFTVVSLYKIFGFPDLGALIVRRQAAPIFQSRKYFGGGTVESVVCGRENWHAPKTQSLHQSLEDGTLPIRSIIALDSAMDVHSRLFGTMEDVSTHTSFLSWKLVTFLTHLQHHNGARVCAMYRHPPEPPDEFGTADYGPVVAFNLRDQHGAWISTAEFEKLATLKGFHVRTGGVCNPGGIAATLGLEPWEVKSNFSAGFRCGDENDVVNGKPTGVIRVSVGAMSTVSDVDKFCRFIEEFYKAKDDPMDEAAIQKTDCTARVPDQYVVDLVVYPIKSCGGYHIPKSVRWDIKPEGLAWDREWCLIHRGTGQALSQKRYPRMALLRPTIDLKEGVLRVVYHGEAPEQLLRREISIPLSSNPDLFDRAVSSCGSITPRVCGDRISAQTYRSPEINDFFSGLLEVPCALARFPPGGQDGMSMRHAKAHLQKHQLPPTGAQSEAKTTDTRKENMAPGGADVSTNTNGNSNGTEKQRILLSNESPILVVNLASVHALNEAISPGAPVSADVFRANIVVGSSHSEDDRHDPTPDQPFGTDTEEDEHYAHAAQQAGQSTLAYSEDRWTALRIGTQLFRAMGACRRCHMVCIDQSTAAKREEPFVTLARTRRFDGKVFFGVHMCHAPVSSGAEEEGGGTGLKGKVAGNGIRGANVGVGDAVLAISGSWSRG